MWHKKFNVTTLLVAAFVTLQPVHAGDDDFADRFISGLKNIDSNLTAIQDKGFGTWAADQAKQIAIDKFPSLLGDASESVEKAQTAESHLQEIESKGMDNFTSGFGGFSTTSDAADSEWMAKQEKFSDWLVSDKSPEMAKDALYMMVPDNVKALAERAETFYNNTEWVADKLEAGTTAASDYVGSVTRRVSSYFSGDSNYGLEPGSADSRLAAASTNPSENLLNSGDAQVAQEAAVPASDTGVNLPSSPAIGDGRSSGFAFDSSTSDSGSSAAPSQKSSNTTSNAAPENDLVADLRSAGWDSSSTRKDNSAISADDLAALGGTGQSASGSATSQIDADSLQADLSDWDGQQAAEKQARDAERARLAAIEQQRQAEADARQLQTARDYATRQQAAEQAAQDAELASQQQTTPAPAQGTSLFDAVTSGIQSWQALSAASHRSTVLGGAVNLDKCPAHTHPGLNAGRPWCVDDPDTSPYRPGSSK